MKYPWFLCILILIAGCDVAAAGDPIKPGCVYWVPKYKTLATVENITIEEGGFGSAIARDPDSASSFYLLTDRGPNFDLPGNDKKGFACPDFAPSIAQVQIEGANIKINKVIALQDANNHPMTGRAEGGIDPEGLVVLADHTFWVSDEYGPFLMHFDENGKLLKKIGPGGGLPRVFARRRSNRGMEGLTKSPDGKLLIGMMQSPLDNPDADVRNGGRIARILIYNLETDKTEQYLYCLRDPENVISDLAALSPTRFLVIERDSKVPGNANNAAKFKKIMRADISKCKDSSDPADGAAGLLVDGRAIEQTPVERLQKLNFVAETTEALDLLKLNYPHEKAEGICIINDTTIAICNDDDFGIEGDGKGGLRRKRVPGLLGEPDRVSIRIFSIPAR